jgi:SOS-response transcriptional repressor LexA
MSSTSYGSWRYLFAQQKKLEAALASGVERFSELAEALVSPKPSRQLRLIPLDDARVKKEAFKTLLPLYSLKAAAGYFGKGESVEPEGWIEATGVGRLDEKMFIAPAVGRSMEPTIYDGDYVVFRAEPVGTRQGKIVLAQYRGDADPETGGAYTVKRYRSEKRVDADTEWRHSKITLEPLNREFQARVISENEVEAFRIVAEFVAVLK